MIRSSQTITNSVKGQMFEIFSYHKGLEGGQEVFKKLLEFLQTRAK